MSFQVIQLYWLMKNNAEAEDIDKSGKQTMNNLTCAWECGAQNY